MADIGIKISYFPFFKYILSEVVDLNFWSKTHLIRKVLDLVL